MFGGDFMRDITPLQSLIARAVDPYKHEPDYAAHLEVADYINKKKANTPREAAMTIVRIVNNRNPHISILALALLETLVNSCGYPFHLQIATKEFLNELVRRFPERPPPFPGPVMSKILELIHTWKETICVESRWKEDLGNIRDMHRLLTFKGYRFRDFARTQSTAVASTSNLKSAEELEEEDRAAQSAKLQELIRRGTPRDLAAAQELMKTLAGAEPEKKPDYRSQSLTELNKLEQKVILLNEMLDNVDTQRGEKFASGDVYDQVSNILVSARPKIQKWISEAESNDPEMLDIFLQMNDQINSVINRYDAFKRGDYASAANPVPSELAGSSRTQDTSLIDFDDPAPGSTATSSSPTNDLAGLFTAAAAPIPQPQSNPAPAQPFSNFTGGTSFLRTSMPMQTTSFASPQPRPHQPHQPQPQIPSNGKGVDNGSRASAATLESLFGPSASSPTPGQGRGASAGAGAGQAGASNFGSIMLPGTPKPGQTGLAQTPQAQSGVGWAWGTTSTTSTTASSSRSQGGIINGGAPGTTAAVNANAQTGGAGKGKDPFADLAGLF